MPHYTGGLPRIWLIVALLVVYLWGLGSVGFLGPDEPRYASIGREMAQTHDFVTPKLDGQPWYEKPPLLYWMAACGHFLHLPDEWAARLPVALASIVFLIFFYATLEREFSARVALAAAVILATSVGWLAFSFAAVTDLPMSAAFWGAMLIAMFDTRRNQGYLAGALLGLAVLGKGLVPLVLFVPVLLIARGKRLTMLAGCILIAAPWYGLVVLRNGRVAMEELIWKHHFERFLSPSLQHVQPFWYYLPILLAGFFPWTPLFGLLVRRKTYDDVRVRFLVAWAIYTLVFFSASVNKLPGYVLPMLPAIAIMAAVGLDKCGASAGWWLGASVAMLVVVPAVVAAVPVALLAGLRKAPLAFAPGIPFVLLAILVWWLAWRGHPKLAIAAAGLTAAAAILYVKSATLPELDQRVSVRAFWRSHKDAVANGCVEEGVRREWVYGLNYYAGHPLPACTASSPVRIAEQNRALTISQR
jgi:4-amino-4-deoxy-L-arabinose transferase-like glycosyltransferase